MRQAPRGSSKPPSTWRRAVPSRTSTWPPPTPNWAVKTTLCVSARNSDGCGSSPIPRSRERFGTGLVADPLLGEPFRTRLARLFDGLGEEEFLAYGRSWRDRLPGYYVLMRNPKILDAVESLIGPEIFSNPVYNVRPKVPRVAAGAVPWHQDKSYWPDANSNPVITVWISLVDATLENGCLHMIPRTQHERLLSFDAETYSGTGYLQVDDRHLDQTLKSRVRALPVKVGTAVLFNDRLIHSSTPNNSDHVRWSVDLRYQPTDQDPMPQYGAGFLARSRKHPDRVASLEDWLAGRPEASPSS